MKCRVDYYTTARGESPVKQFIDSLPVKLQAKNMRELSLLETFGVDLPACQAAAWQVGEGLVGAPC